MQQQSVSNLVSRHTNRLTYPYIKNKVDPKYEPRTNMYTPQCTKSIMLKTLPIFTIDDLGNSKTPEEVSL